MSPVSLLEAQILGKPVIATKVGGIPEEIIDGKTGFLVKKGDHEDIISKISILFNDQNKANQMGINGIKFVKENFEWGKIAEKFIIMSKKYLN